MIAKLKKLFYFPIAYYFRFFAQVRLSFWKPRIIVVTGSSGKTTLLHLLESQLGNNARYSHKANSSFGIPFNILGLERKTLAKSEWPLLFLKAPFKAFANPFREKFYVVEADCDRPYEGKFLSTLLRPEVTLWLSVSRTHSMNFEREVQKKGLKTVEEAIAHEFGYFIEYASKLVIVNKDVKFIKKQLTRTGAKIQEVSDKDLKDYRILKNRTEFTINKKTYSLNAVLPRDFSYSIEMVDRLISYFKLKLDPSFAKFTPPPGRSSVFAGIKKTTIIDSSYNNSLYAIKSMIEVLKNYPKSPKWLVLGDILEQGNYEKEEHEKIADIIRLYENILGKIIFVGPRVSEYTYPKLNSQINSRIEKFLLPKDAIFYLLKNIRGGEVILFKGARFLEGVIEHLLLNKNDVGKLARREEVWEKWRKKWGL